MMLTWLQMMKMKMPAFTGKLLTDRCLIILFHLYFYLQWYGHVLQKEDSDWVQKCMEYEVEGSRSRGRPKRTWKEVVYKDC